jgi:hypothetical protein
MVHRPTQLPGQKVREPLYPPFPHFPFPSVRISQSVRLITLHSLAYMEIRSVLAHMLWWFDMTLCDDSRGWAMQQRFEIVWDRPPLHVKLTQRGGRSEVALRD